MRGVLLVRKLLVLGKEIQLSADLSPQDVQKNLISILRDVDPELAEEVEKSECRVKLEGEVIVVYRLGAVFG